MRNSPPTGEHTIPDVDSTRTPSDEDLYRMCWTAATRSATNKMFFGDLVQDVAHETYLVIKSALHRGVIQHPNKRVVWSYITTTASRIMGHEKRRMYRAEELPESPDPTSIFKQVSTQEIIDRTVPNLPGIQRTLLEMVIAGYSATDIQSAMGLTDAQYRNYKHRAVRRCRSILEGQ